MSDPSCPICRSALAVAGHTERCGTCNGAWIHEDALVAMLEASTAALVSLPWKPRVAKPERPCAVCGRMMEPVSLGTVALDRCEAHGVWFDRNELADLLAQSKKFRDEPTDHISWLERIANLFD
jgi:Zn-finger nucleic acid-binding protein